MIFFDKQELEYFSQVAGKSYRKANPENLRSAELIKPNIKKLNHWVSEALIEDFEAKLDKTWQWSGTFKTYLWIRIYRKNHSKKVYFVLGIDSNGNLYLELNCQRSNHTGGSTEVLPKEIIQSFDTYLSQSEYAIKKVFLDDIETYDWHRLIIETQNYFYRYASTYDELEALSNIKNITQIPNISFTLTPSDIPSSTKSYAKRQKQFKGRHIDWSKKQMTSNKLGIEGEKLVLKIEKDKIKNFGFLDKVEKIEKKLDGEGYDILSFNEDGEEIFIEVKTTNGGIDEPFYISTNEKAFCDLYKLSYFIYRLYDYNYNTKSAKYYIIKGTEISNFNFTPINFEVSKNKI